MNKKDTQETKTDICGQGAGDLRSQLKTNLAFLYRALKILASGFTTVNQHSVRNYNFILKH